MGVPGGGAAGGGAAPSGDDPGGAVGPLGFFVIVWDAEGGHVAYLQPLGKTGSQHKGSLAVAVASNA